MFFSTMNSPLDNFWFSLIQQSNDNMMSLIHIYIYIYIYHFSNYMWSQLPLIPYLNLQSPTYRLQLDPFLKYLVRALAATFLNFIFLLRCRKNSFFFFFFFLKKKKSQLNTIYVLCPKQRKIQGIEPKVILYI